MPVGRSSIGSGLSCGSESTAKGEVILNEDQEQYCIELARTKTKALILLPKNQYASLGWGQYIGLRLPSFKKVAGHRRYEAELKHLKVAFLSMQKRLGLNALAGIF